MKDSLATALRQSQGQAQAIYDQRMANEKKAAALELAMFFWLICITLYTSYLALLQNHLYLKCQLLHLTTLQVSFFRVL